MSVPVLAGTSSTKRVIVFLREPLHAEPDLASPERRVMIRDLQQSVLDRLGEGNANVYARWALVPGFAAEVPDTVLEQLRHDPDVLAADPVVDGGASLAESVPLINGHTTRGMGYTGSGVPIAIVDTGVNKTHTDLAGSVTAEACFCTTSGGSGCCPNGSTSQTGSGAANDDNGHGTHVAGIAASRGNAASYGVAPGASLVAVKVLQANGTFNDITQVISGLDWILNNHPEVRAVNMSLGTFALFTGTCDNVAAWSMSLASVINSLKANGTAVFASSMNNNSASQMGAPACIANTIAVGAVYDANFGTSTVGCTESTAADKITCFSNTSTALDLLAPGAAINSSYYLGGTATFYGTSMASPHAAGAAAVLFGAKPSLTAAQVEAALKNTGPLIFDSRISLNFPRVDVLAALNSILSCTYAISPAAATVPFGAGTGAMTVTGTPANCSGSWSAGEAETWLTLTGTVSGSGAGTWQVPYSHSANAGASRTGIVTFSGAFPVDNTFALTQLAAGGLPNGDFNGDGKADVGVFRPSTAFWYSNAFQPISWGANGDIPVPADYNGDGKTDIAVFRPSTGFWYSNAFQPISWGTNGDIPVPADYNGDGKDDIAVFRPSTGMWYSNAFAPILWGANGDVPVPGDYNGDGKDDIAVFRPSTGMWYSNAFAPVLWGTNGDVPVPADYNGDGKTDIAVWRPSTGMWYGNAFSPTSWGVNGDKAVPADYNGDGKADIAVFRPSTGMWYSNAFNPTLWGANGDFPLTLPVALRHY